MKIEIGVFFAAATLASSLAACVGWAAGACIVASPLGGGSGVGVAAVFCSTLIAGAAVDGLGTSDSTGGAGAGVLACTASSAGLGVAGSTLFGGSDTATSGGISLCTNRCGSANSVGLSSEFAIMTRVLSLVRRYSRTAKSCGMRIQPCDALWPILSPSCIATPDQVMRCM